MKFPRIKFCGMTEAEDAVLAAKLGVDAIGLTFVENSPRHVSVEQAKKIIAAVPKEVICVGVFVNPTEDEVKAVLAEVTLDCLQFHGEESADFCEGFHVPYMKAVKMQAGQEVLTVEKAHPHAWGLLLDAYDPNRAGGTGQSFSWDLIPDGIQKPWLLAGGLTPETVAKAIAQAAPDGVDVVTGIEAYPGKKDPDKMKAFMKACHF